MPIETPTGIVIKVSGGSGTGAVTLALTAASDPGCVLTSDVFSNPGNGGCMVRATKAGDATYLPATSIQSGYFFMQLGPPPTEPPAPVRHHHQRSHHPNAHR